METDWSRVTALIDQLYNSTDELEVLFPGRKFTLDGHLVGSVGEVVASFMFDLELNSASTIAHDAQAKDGRSIEIKLTQGKKVALRHEPEHLIVLTRPKGSTISVAYNGPGREVWEPAGKMQKNGQRAIGLADLKGLDGCIMPEQRLPVRRDAPI